MNLLVTKYDINELSREEDIIYLITKRKDTYPSNNSFSSKSFHQNDG